MVDFPASYVSWSRECDPGGDPNFQHMPTHSMYGIVCLAIFSIKINLNVGTLQEI